MRSPTRAQISALATSQAWMYPSGYISPSDYISWNLLVIDAGLLPANQRVEISAERENSRDSQEER
jgi:hypothetical protein